MGTDDMQSAGAIGIGKSTSMEAIAGGAAWVRFSHTILWLERVDEEERTVVTAMGTTGCMVNRLLHVRKARNGPGVGQALGLYFDSRTLLLAEQGVVME